MAATIELLKLGSLWHRVLGPRLRAEGLPGGLRQGVRVRRMDREHH